MIEAQITAIVLILFRIAAFIAFMPPLNGQGMPNTVKVGLAAAITVLLAPTYMQQTALLLQSAETSEQLWTQLAYHAARETALGAGMAWLFGLCLVPVRVGGAWIAQEMGLTMGGLTSPMDQQQTNVVSQMMEAIGALMFFALDLHHVFFWLLGRSLEFRPTAGAWSMPSWNTVLGSVSNSVNHGLVLVAPIGILLFVTVVMLLITIRSAPQFNFMSYGMSLRIAAGMLGVVFFFPEISGAIQNLLSHVTRTGLI
ncbi:MAG: flagellar biosynthetic protein FliR [Planctomyces sp.]|nr:flagellar biosynthetic protein FliR [Planctomyces sp.]